MIEQVPSKDLSMALLREWHLADERFDLEDWSRRVRNFVEDAPQFFRNEDGDIDFGPISLQSGSAEPAGDAAAAAGAEPTAALSRSSGHEPLQIPPNVRRYKVQQDQGIYALKGCDDGDLVDWSAYEALLRRASQPPGVQRPKCPTCQQEAVPFGGAGYEFICGCPTATKGGEQP